MNPAPRWYDQPGFALSHEPEADTPVETMLYDGRAAYCLDFPGMMQDIYWTTGLGRRGRAEDQPI